MPKIEERTTRKGRAAPVPPWQIPVVDRQRRIVAWTDHGPEAIGAVLRHAEAEAILHGPIGAAYVELSDNDQARRAGAPLHWKGKWRCLALVNDDIAASATLVVAGMFGGAAPRRS